MEFSKGEEVEWEGIFFSPECFAFAYYPFEVRKVAIGEDPIATDKFGGRPFLYLDETWPVCSPCERPMNFWFQLSDPPRGKSDGRENYTTFHVP